MAVNEAFERDYDEAEYEQKIGTLIRSFRINARKDNRDEFNRWTDAVHTIRPEDHFLLVLIDAEERTSGYYGDRLPKLVLIGFLITGVVLALSYLILSS